MYNEVIPQEIQQFVLSHIDSVAQLEGLLLFHSAPSLAGNADLVAQRLYISQDEASRLLRHLHMAGFLAVTSGENPTYFYHPRTSDVASLVDQLASLYVNYLVPITNLIHSKPKTRIQEFADAFWIRKDKE